MRIGVIAAAALIVLPTVAVSAKSDQPAKEKKICRSTEVTGTRFASATVCRTAAEWNAIAESTRRDMELRQRNDFNPSQGAAPR